MMLMSALLTLSALAAVVSAQQGLPPILIFQAKTTSKADAEMNISMADYIANEFLTQGKAIPIVYGSTDPTFRIAVEDRKIVRPPRWPSLNEGFGIASKLGAHYVLTYELGGSKKSDSSPKATLYFNSRKIWSETLNAVVSQSGGVDSSQSGQSSARTWVMHISYGPLKSVVAQQQLSTPTEAVGQAPKPLEVVLAPKVEDDSQLRAKVDQLIQSSDYGRATTLLRDSVDEKPFDIDRRILLVQTLLDSHRSAEAGEEADRAVLLAPDRPELRALAARAWMAAGKSDEARSALNEAIARDPNGSRTRLMLAELSLARLEPDKALDHLDQAIKQHPSRQAFYLHGLCKALLGDPDAVTADFAEAKKLPSTESASELQRDYALAAGAIDDSVKSLGDETRLLMQRALSRPDDTSTREKVAVTLRLTQARQAYLSGFPTPILYKGSNDRRSLALSLFVQTLLSVQSYFSGGGQDAMTEARVDLGEALKEAAGARSAFAAEQKPSGQPGE